MTEHEANIRPGIFHGIGAAIFFICATASAATTDKTHVFVPIGKSYKLVFDDEFNGTSLDSSKWNVLSSSGMGGGYAQDEFVPQNASEESGFLTLSATHGSPSGRLYSAASLFTKQSWSYGYWEARAKMPNGHGIWPAFWMNNHGSYPEIDIFEWLGNRADQQWETYHPANDVALTGGGGFGTTHTGSDYSAAFHVYGMLWKPDSITWYIDGVQVFSLRQGEIYKGKTVDITGMPMQTILNSAVGGWNRNVVDSSTVFPTTCLVDYVHIYSASPDAVAITPESGYGGPGDAGGSR